MVPYETNVVSMGTCQVVYLKFGVFCCFSKKKYVFQGKLTSKRIKEAAKVGRPAVVAGGLWPVAG